MRCAATPVPAADASSSSNGTNGNGSPVVFAARAAPVSTIGSACVSDRRAPRRPPARRGDRRPAATAPLSRSRYPSFCPLVVGLIGTNAAPARSAPKIESTASTPFSRWIATRSPRATPSERKPAATRSGRGVELARRSADDRRRRGPPTRGTLAAACASSSINQQPALPARPACATRRRRRSEPSRGSRAGAHDRRPRCRTAARGKPPAPGRPSNR